MGNALERVNAAYGRVEVARRERAVSRPASVSARRGKAWSEPPFWALDAMRLPFMSSLPDRERIEHDFDGYVRGAGKASGVVFSCFYTRLRHYAQAKFCWENLSTGELFTTAGLQLLQFPSPNQRTADMLGWFELDATFAGNSYWTTADDLGRFGKQAAGSTRRLVRMRPDWVWILIESQSGDPYALDARVVAFVYDPMSRAVGGAYQRAEPVILTPQEVVHYAPVPDGEARHRGMSWLTPILREVAADRAATQHKLSFFERGASLQTIVALDKDISVDAFDEFVSRFRATHEGTDNAYGTLFVGGGADVTVTSANLSELDYKGVQGGTETRVANAAGVHPVVVGMSEGLAGSSLNAGNYKAAMRNVSDGTLTHLWEVTVSALETVAPPPPVCRLWIDKRKLAFMQDDATDIAQIQQINASALMSLYNAGWDDMDAAVEYLSSNDIRKLLGRHSGRSSVQTQPGGDGAAAAGSNGGVNGSEVDAELRKELAAIAGRW